MLIGLIGTIIYYLFVFSFLFYIIHLIHKFKESKGKIANYYKELYMPRKLFIYPPQESLNNNTSENLDEVAKNKTVSMYLESRDCIHCKY